MIENHARNGEENWSLRTLFRSSCLVVLEMSRKFRCHLGAATHHANAPLAPKARICARKYFLNATRRERFYSRVCFSKQRRPFKHKCAGFGSLSKGRKRGLKNVKAGLEFQSRARANTHDANDKNKFSFTYLLASIDVRV